MLHIRFAIALFFNVSAKRILCSLNVSSFGRIYCHLLCPHKTSTRKRSQSFSFFVFLEQPSCPKKTMSSSEKQTLKRSKFFPFFIFLEKFCLREIHKKECNFEKTTIICPEIWRFPNKCLILQNLSGCPVPRTFRNEASKS